MATKKKPRNKKYRPKQIRVPMLTFMPAINEEFIYIDTFLKMCKELGVLKTEDNDIVVYNEKQNVYYNAVDVFDSILELGKVLQEKTRTVVDTDGITVLIEHLKKKDNIQNDIIDGAEKSMSSIKRALMRMDVDTCAEMTQMLQIKHLIHAEPEKEMEHETEQNG